MAEGKIVVLAGAVDGANTTFTAPNAFVIGSLRLILNGQVYEASDTRKGWSEIDDSTIQLAVAPLAGDIVQAFYQDRDAFPDLAVGSPFHPTGDLP